MFRKLLYVYLIISFLFAGCAANKNSADGKSPAKNSEVEKLTPGMKKILKWCAENKQLLKSALDDGKTIYYKSVAGIIKSKSFGKEDIIAFPENGNSWFPRYSPDRQNLYLWISERGDNSSIIAGINKNGELRVLKECEQGTSYFDVSPDGNLIAYTVKKDNLFQIFLYDVKENKSGCFSDTGVGGVYPSFTPDGKSIVYVASRKIRLRDINTLEERILVDDKDLKEFIKVSSCGRYVLYQGYNEQSKKYTISKYDFTNKTNEVIYKSDTLCANPAFNQKGDKIVFVKSDDTFKGSQKLAVMNSDGTDVQVDPTSETDVYFPVF